MDITLRQHYIPRFFLRNFSVCENPEAKKKRRKYKTYVYTPVNGIELLTLGTPSIVFQNLTFLLKFDKYRQEPERYYLLLWC